MPELPDITVYVERLTDMLGGQPLEKIRLASPFLLRTVTPSLDAFQGLMLKSVDRRGKRLVFVFPGEMHLVLHLMVAGRLHWKPRSDGAPGDARVKAKSNTRVTKEGSAGVTAPIPKSNGLMALDFPSGTVLLTESGTKKRAALHAVQGVAKLQELFPVGLEPLEATLKQFAEVLKRENHTLKRSLTDPRLFSGIGNSYSDEILHRAQLSPVLLTSKLTDAQIHVLFKATQEILKEWTNVLRAETGNGFPAKVTAFRAAMAVHGRHGKPCPVCGSPVQRIRYAENETNYCPTCQTGGKLLADRALSSLLKKDWPRSLEEIEKLLAKHRDVAAEGNLGVTP